MSRFSDRGIRFQSTMGWRGSRGVRWGKCCGMRRMSLWKCCERPMAFTLVYRESIRDPQQLIGHNRRGKKQGEIGQPQTSIVQPQLSLMAATWPSRASRRPSQSLGSGSRSLAAPRRPQTPSYLTRTPRAFKSCSQNSKMNCAPRFLSSGASFVTSPTPSGPFAANMYNASTSAGSA